jgi:broad specificity phosphatase PhoE/predicted kinase
MENKKLYIVMVGLPASGKSTIAAKLKENLVMDGARTRIFNNGNLRRKLIKKDTSYPEFYDQNNREGVSIREKIALVNIQRSKDFLGRKGQVAILDATNVSLKRREMILQLVNKRYPVLFIECINNNEKILEASILRKVSLPEFAHLEKEEAIQSFKQRIRYYSSISNPLCDERDFITLDSLNNRIMQEKASSNIPFYDRIRDFLVTDIIKNLFLIRHGETFFNQENRIGGNSALTKAGIAQAETLARYFRKKTIPIIFTSKKIRARQTAEPIKRLQKSCSIIALEEFNEIDSGVCESLSYEEIREKMPKVYADRKKDKYNYIYPDGEGYVSMEERVIQGVKKALYLSNNSRNIMIIGHRAVNRMILAHFLYRRQEDVPYTYIPQDKFYHIVATQDKKIFQLKDYNR